MFRINRMFTVLLLVALILSACQPVVAQPQARTPALPEGGAIAQVNDIEMYYEIHGEGEPVLLIHGAIGSSEDFATVAPAFVEAGYQTIGVDCRGRGRSTDSGQPLSYALMASDIVALLDELGIEKAHLAGQSDGAIIGLHLAIHYPERVDKIIAFGANYNVNGLFPGFTGLVEQIPLADFDAMTGEEYRRLSPHPEHLPVMLEKIRHMLLTQPNFTLEELMGIQSPVLVFDGEEEDTVRIEHARQLGAAIPNASVVIEPGYGHGLMYANPELYLETALAFLAGELESPSVGKYAAVNDIAMYYEIHGEGEPVLLIHSDIGNTEDFATVIPALVDAGYQAIAMDCRGRGRSTDSGQPFSYALMASDIVAFMDVLGIEKAHIVGEADGGIIGLHMAIHYPERVGKLVSYGANFNIHGLSANLVNLVENIPLEDFDAMIGDDYRRLAPDPDYLAVMLEKLRHQILTQPNFTLPQLMSIRSPVLVFGGEEDDIIPVEHVRQLAAAIPNATLVIQPGAGHHLMQEQPQIYLDTVLAFLAGELDASPVGKYAAVNDIQMYYEIHGEGEPLLLMPSGMWSTGNFAGLTAALAEEYQVIVMDARGRGRSTDSGRRLDIAVMADDVVALMDELEIETAHVVGWADSAIVGLEMAMRYPERVDKLVAYAPNYTVEGLTEEHRAWLKALTLDDMMGMFEEGYARIAPNPAYLPVILERVRALFLTEPNYTLDQLGEITAPTLVLDGEEDEFIVREHLEEMAAAIPNAELAFLPGLSHYAPFEDLAAWTAAVLEFLAEPAAQAVARFEPSECKYPILADANAECGYLVVREDRNNPDSPTIRVHVIKFRSASETPAPDPIIVIPGGPGASGPFYALVWSALPVGDVMRAERDVYIVQPRGAMHSEPAFYCPEMETDWQEMVDMSFAEVMAWNADAYRACHDRFVAQGVNFSAYNSVEIAGDVADLRLALGFDEMNVYGVSYGTTPGLLLMRLYPEGVRSVILDSVMPPDVNWINGKVEYVMGAIDAIFQACTGDSACNAAYPDLESVFTEVLERLRTAPAQVAVTDEAGQTVGVTVDDLRFVHFVVDSIFIGDGFTTLPATVYAAYHGDLQAPAEAWVEFLAGEHGPVTPDAGAWAKGMSYANNCLQYGGAADMATTTALYEQLDANPSVRDWAVTYFLNEWLLPCEYWSVTPEDPDVNTEPVESDLSVLMLAGMFDPESAPALSSTTTERLPNSFYYELPSGHGLILTECALDMIAQFLADPTQAPDASCIGEMEMNWVLPEE